MTPTPVAEAADRLGIPVETPIRSADVDPALRSFQPIELGLLVAYGQLIRPASLEVPRRGILNLHFSLLPRWRGAAPVHRAIMHGDRRTGVTVMRLDEGLDTGPTLSAWSTVLRPDDTTGDVTHRLAVGGAGVLIDTAARYLAGLVRPVGQPSIGATHAPKIESDERWVDWSDPNRVIRRHVHGLSPRPGATASLEGSTLKILRVRCIDDRGESVGHGRSEEGWPVVQCGDGAVRLDEVQPAGKRAMSGADWIRGRRGSPFRLE